MTAEQLKKMVDTLRHYRVEINDRVDLEWFFYNVRDGLKAAGLDNIAEEIQNVINQIELIPTSEIIKLNIFQ